MEPTNRRRVVRALEVTLGSGRPFSAFGPGLEAYPESGMAQVGLSLRAGGDRPPASTPASSAWSRRGWSTRYGRSPPDRPASRGRRVRRSATARSWPTWSDGAPSADCLDEAVRHTRQFARRQASWFRRDPRVGWAGSGAEAQALLDERPSPARLNGAACDNGVMRATKHEGAGNDFLVVLDPDDAIRLSVAQVRLLADRRRGIGADGIIRVGPGRGGCDLSMELHNADGGEAEMSGNGIRCLAQAAVDAGLVAGPRFTVATAGGTRTVEYAQGETPGWATASVDMGPARLGPDQPQEFDDRRARTVDVGNPHLVLLGPDTAAVDIAELGPKLQATFSGGINVEWITPGRDERGSSSTSGCGSGAWARPWPAAPAAWRPPRPPGAGVPWRTPVPSACATPEGPWRSRSGLDEEATTFLAGPVRKVADIDIHPGMLS